MTRIVMEVLINHKNIFNRTKNIALKRSPFFSPVFVQKKLYIGEPDDKYEIEADRVADQVVSRSTTEDVTTSKSGSLVQRKCSTCREEEHIQKKPLAETITPLIQRSVVSSGGEAQASDAISYQISNSRGGGNLMSDGTRGFMENRFGADFSTVRIHTDNNAKQLSNKLNAQAFTIGNDIYFNEGKYNTNSNQGKHLLAHELTHTLQQGGMVQRKENENHNLQAARFKGDIRLEQTFDNERLIYFGAQGLHVMKIQKGLMDIGFELPKFGADGIFGNETKTAVEEFQREFSLKTDGIVGPETMGTLDNIYTSEGNHDEDIFIDDSDDTDVLDGDSGQGVTFPTQENSINQLLAFDGGSEIIQKKSLTNPPKKVNPPAIKVITIDLKSQNLKILWTNGKIRGPYDISSGKGCPNTDGDPCVNPKRSDNNTYCTPKGNSFKAEKLGGKDYKSSKGDAMSWYVAFVSERGIGIHNAQPVTGTPKSHGCVRVIESVAKLIHNNVTTSTIIKVSGKAPTKAWKKNKAKAAKSYKGCPGKKGK